MRLGIIAASVFVVFVIGIGVWAEGAPSTGSASTARGEPDRPAMDPALGAIRVSSDWKQSTFLLITEPERTVVELPERVDLPYGSDGNWVPPEGYGPVGLWTELPPGRYVLIAGSPGKQLAETPVDVVAGKEVWLNAGLQPETSRIRRSEPMDKIGPTWSKSELVRANVKWREPGTPPRVEKCPPGSG